MDDLNTILTLTPADKLGLAFGAFRLPHNRSRYVKPSAFMDNSPSRETTPCESLDDDVPVDDSRYHHCIIMTFGQETRKEGRFTFGSDPDLCDVLLASKRGQHKISRRHFYITFDDQQRPVIIDNSTNGLTVSYDGQAENERRSHFHWIIFDNFKKITVTLRKNGLAFDIHLPQHYKTHREEYKNKVNIFTADAPSEHLLAFDNLALRSQGTSFAPSESLSPSKRPIYLKRRELGRGAFGLVRKVIDASTGHQTRGKSSSTKKAGRRRLRS